MVFRVRLDNLDFYSTLPSELDPSLPTISRDVSPQVPVLRIFGSTESGERVCAHVHGVLPYLYVEYPAAYVTPKQFNLETAQVEIRKLRRNIDAALKARYSKGGYINNNNRTRKKSDGKTVQQYVATIALVKGVPFYGYNVGWKLYCKIYLYSPRHISGLMDELLGGGVAGRPLQPFEGHINYTMQFLIDYNLYGCGFVEVDEERVKYRRVYKKNEDEEEKEEEWGSPEGSRSDEDHDALPEDRFPKHSYHGWEVDIRAADILNRYEIVERRIHQDFSAESAAACSTGLKHLHSLDELWKAHGERTQPEASGWSVPASTAREDTKQEPWVEEQDYRDAIRDHIDYENRSRHARKVTLRNILRRIPYECYIPTAFESVDYLASFDTVPPRRPGKGEQAAEEVGSRENAAAERVESMDKTVDVQMKGKAGGKPEGDEEDEDYGLDGIDFDAIPLEALGCEGLEDQQTVEHGVLGEQNHIESHPSLPASGELRTEILTQHAKRKFSEISDSLPLLWFDLRSSHDPSQPPDSAVLGLREAFSIGGTHPIFHYSKQPPSMSEIQKSESKLGIIYTNTFYGKRADMPRKKYQYGPTKFDIKTHDPIHLPAFDPDVGKGYKRPYKWPKVEWPNGRVRSTRISTWMYALEAPTLEEVCKWESDTLAKSGELNGDRVRAQLLSQIEGPTQNSHGLAHKPARKNNKSGPLKKSAGMCVMGLEIHVNTIGDLVPDPKINSIACVFWCVQPGGGGKTRLGILAVGDGLTEDMFRRFADVEVSIEPDEMYMMNSLVNIVRDLDPDILTGYEIHSSSWGYIIERAKHLEGLDLINEFSRAKIYTSGRAGSDVDLYNVSHQGVVKITGRHTINIWRAMKGELRLLGYNMENVVFHLLGKRIPHYAYKDLTAWFQGGIMAFIHRVIKYFLIRVRLDLEILEKQDFITIVSEHARLIGVDFQSVFNRGSQLKVESLMFRIAKPESYILVSPSRRQVSSQNAIESIALNMEPDSRFYNNPVVVLDFQSLYPSIMIAYNYCYSTCLGRIVRKGRLNKLGFTEYKRPLGLLGLHEENINVSPNGMMFVKPHVRQSLLAKMLSEILDTRVMVKDRMKRDKDDKHLQQMLNSWQLALKLTANVTYGYTSASFSGRMPCSEIADSIVQSGRETLEKAINLINNEEGWGARVVYGDTDSLFVELPGRSKDEAFDIGYEIAERVTAMNPKPIKLKFEKVYLPSVLLMKKRYVGLKYEYRDQKEPDFDAKGIETVRRDYFPAIQKMQETALKIHFRTQDLSQVKEYCLRQWTKMMQGKVSVQDFCIAKEVKLANSREGAPIQPHMAIAKKRRDVDHRNEPQFGERIPYVVIAGGLEHQRISDRAIEVDRYLHSPHLMLDIDYYIQKKMIPPLARIFNVIGAPVALWYKEMPKYRRPRVFVDDGKRKAPTLDGWLIRDNLVCYICRGKTSSGKVMCPSCSESRDVSIYKTQIQLCAAQKRMHDIRRICVSCSDVSRPEELKCDSLDCPVYYSRVKETQRHQYEDKRAKMLLQALRAL